KTRPDRTPISAKIKLARVRLPAAYWKYLLATAVFGIGNASNSFLILQTQDIGASLETTIIVYAAFNLVAALISYPAGFLSDRIGHAAVFIYAASFALAGGVALWILTDTPPRPGGA